MTFRPYHNPDKVDESKVPEGWRWRYADEIGKRAPRPCRAWGLHDAVWTRCDKWHGTHSEITYIVPVNS